jgi:hypothetical protein
MNPGSMIPTLTKEEIEAIERRLERAGDQADAQVTLVAPLVRKLLRLAIMGVCGKCGEKIDHEVLFRDDPQYAALHFARFSRLKAVDDKVEAELATPGGMR